MTEKSKDKFPISGDSRRMRRYVDSVASTLGVRRRAEYYKEMETHYRTRAEQLGETTLGISSEREADYYAGKAEECAGV